MEIEQIRERAKLAGRLQPKDLDGCLRHKFGKEAECPYCRYMEKYVGMGLRVWEPADYDNSRREVEKK